MQAARGIECPSLANRMKVGPDAKKKSRLKRAAERAIYLDVMDADGSTD